MAVSRYRGPIHASESDIRIRDESETTDNKDTTRRTTKICLFFFCRFFFSVFMHMMFSAQTIKGQHAEEGYMRNDTSQTCYKEEVMVVRNKGMWSCLLAFYKWTRFKLRSC